MYSAVRHAKQTRCPNWKGLFAVSLGAGRAYQLACKRWDCATCSPAKFAAARLLFEAGMRAARDRGERVRFITLTLGAGGGTIPELSAAWNRLRTRLIREGKLREYAAVVEPQRRRAPHLHVLATGEYIAQRTLSQWAEKAGFGRVTDIRAVRDERSVATYGTKMAHYVGKQSTRGFTGLGVVRRIRPVRCSRSWYPGGFTAAERHLQAMMRERLDLEPVPGPWVMAVRGGDGELRLLNPEAANG